MGILAEITAAGLDVSGIVVTIGLGVFGWFLRNMHTDNKRRLENIDTSLAPLALIGERVGNLNEIVREHVKILPDLKTDMALVKERQEQQGGKIETINNEVSKLREWRHDVSDSLHENMLHHALRLDRESDKKP